MKTNNILDSFILVKSNINKNDILIDIDQYGEYRLGLTHKEVEYYIKARCSLLRYKNKFKNVKKAIAKFWDIAGSNTVTVNSLGESLMYRSDVLRFSNYYFNREPTFFD